MSPRRSSTENGRYLQDVAFGELLSVFHSVRFRWESDFGLCFNPTQASHSGKN